MCAKDDLIRRKGPLRLAGELATAESITAKDPNHVDTFSSDFAFSLKANQHFFIYQNILSLIAFIISHRLFADKLVYALNRATVVPIIISVDKTQLLLISGDIAAYTLLARFIPTTKIRDPLLKSQVYHYCISKLLSQNAAKSRILLACADGRTRQCYLTIYAILADYEEQVLLTSVKKNRYCTRYTVAPNNREDLLTQESSKQKVIIQQLIAVVSLLFVSKAPFALHFIRAVCDLVTLAQYKSHDEDTLAYIQGALERINVFKEEFRVYQQTLGEEKNFNYPKALDSICTRANSEAHHITIVKQFYSITNKKEYILQICLHNSQKTALLAADYATIVKQSRPSTTVDIQDRTYSTRLIPGIQPHSTKLLLSEVAANIAISNFTHAAALHLILTIIDYTRYDKDRKHMAYIRAFSEVLLFNNNRQIDNTTGMLTFKFYDLSTIIRPVHLVLRDLPNLTTRTTISYYVNNYID
ncbi:hypothetical protein HBH51_235750 [Parastagonospora nodorum]|nr:hypothetical protein HBH51_235750 [Parastagonospora nodorum]